MKRLLLIPLVLLASCTSTRVEVHTLVPAIVSAWPAVRSDVMEADEPPMEDVALMDIAVKTESRGLLRRIQWGPLQAAATEGIQNQLDVGTIGPNGAILLQEQLTQMTAAMLQLQKTLIVSSQVLGLPTTEQRVAERRAFLSYSNLCRTSR